MTVQSKSTDFKAINRLIQYSCFCFMFLVECLGQSRGYYWTFITTINLFTVDGEKCL
jgi:hypothetical protein